MQIDLCTKDKGTESYMHTYQYTELLKQMFDGREFCMRQIVMNAYVIN